MKHSSFNHVRMHRLRHAMTTEELAFLINQRSATAVSLYETGDRLPTLDAAFALQVVFGVDPSALLREHFEAIEEAVMRRAQALHEELEGQEDERSLKVRALLDEMARREWDKSDSA